MKQRPSITTPPALQQKSSRVPNERNREAIHTKDGRLSPQNLSDSDEPFQLLLTSASLISRISFFEHVNTFSSSNIYTRTPALLGPSAKSTQSCHWSQTTPRHTPSKSQSNPGQNYKNASYNTPLHRHPPCHFRPRSPIPIPISIKRYAIFKCSF